MLTSEVLKLSPLDRFVYFVKERRQIYLRRKMGKPKPWTDDHILNSYRFTNVRRMDDRVSAWLMDHWYRSYFDHPNMLVACGLARFYNLPATLEPLTKYVFTRQGKSDWRGIRRELVHRRDSGQNVFNAAYIVSTSGNKADKTEFVLDRYVKPLESVQLVTETIQEMCTDLLKCYGFSGFMAGQVTADLRWAVSGSWRDRNTWHPMGPGSKRGINRVFGRPINYSLSQSQFIEELGELRAVLKKSAPAIERILEAIDIQSLCCETDKYFRVLLGEGRPKQKYPGV